MDNYSDEEEVMDSVEQVNRIFEKNKNFIHGKMREIVENKRVTIELNANILECEKQKKILNEYVKSSETLLASTDELREMMLTTTEETSNVQNAITDVKKGITALVSEKQKEANSLKSNDKMVVSLKKLLCEMYDNSFNSLTDKKSKLAQLKKENELTRAMFEAKNQKVLGYYVEQYERLKAKNAQLKASLAIQRRRAVTKGVKYTEESS